MGNVSSRSSKESKEDFANLSSKVSPPSNDSKQSTTAIVVAGSSGSEFVRKKIIKSNTQSDIDKLEQFFSNWSNLLECFPFTQWSKRKDLEAYDEEWMDSALSFYNLQQPQRSGGGGGEEPVVRVKFLLSGRPSKLVSKIASFTFEPKYGVYHTALQIGNIIVDWVDNSLCYPRAASSSTALVAIDLGVLPLNPRKPFEELCQLMSDWNTKKEYNQWTTNCQHFVDEAIKTLGLNQQFQDLQKLGGGAIGEFMNWLRTGKEIKEIPGLSKIDPSPKNLMMDHSTYDGYVRELFLSESTNGTKNIIKASEEFRSKHPDVWTLLKAFDRAYWIRYFSVKKKEGTSDFSAVEESKTKALGVQEGCNVREEFCSKCPFPFTEPSKQTANVQFS